MYQAGGRRPNVGFVILYGNNKRKQSIHLVWNSRKIQAHWVTASFGTFQNTDDDSNSDGQSNSATNSTACNGCNTGR
jgi:hypothetical protein